MVNNTWVADGVIEDMQLYCLTGLDVVNGSECPNWISGSEFKAATDA